MNEGQEQRLGASEDGIPGQKECALGGGGRGLASLEGEIRFPRKEGTWPGKSQRFLSSSPRRGQ